MTALVLDAHLKSSLAAIRSLGRRGIPVIAASHRSLAMGLHSRYAGARFVHPSPFQDRLGFVREVLRQAPAASVLLPFSDSTLLPLLHESGVLGDRLLYPLPACRDRFDIAFDKARTMELARCLGVETPATYVCEREDDFFSVLPKISYPAVVKPRRSLRWEDNGALHSTAVFAFSADDLRRKFLGILARSGEYPLIQEYVQGEEAGVEFLCDRGRVVAACAHRRIRSSPPAGGPGAVKESVPLSYAGMGKRAARLAEALEWHGPIMVEFKIDRASGTPNLMEINGRFWGSLPLAIAAGVDFPYLHYRMALGEPVETSLNYREGVVTRHLQADSKSLLYVLFKRDPMRPYAYPGRLAALGRFFRHCRPDIADLHDLKPGVVELLDAGWRATAKTILRRRAC